ncbi:hypothetical protein B0H11DRAFT_1037053 [Mycena galericulata]|nr:hypothetical protein B0H11DRAFT_1037053 [Mycena galericulata]
MLLRGSHCFPVPPQPQPSIDKIDTKMKDITNGPALLDSGCYCELSRSFSLASRSRPSSVQDSSGDRLQTPYRPSGGSALSIIRISYKNWRWQLAFCTNLRRNGGASEISTFGKGSEDYWTCVRYVLLSETILVSWIVLIRSEILIHPLDDGRGFRETPRYQRSSQGRCGESLGAKFLRPFNQISQICNVISLPLIQRGT